MRAHPQRGIRLLVAQPGLGADLARDEFAVAHDEVVVPALQLPRGDVDTLTPLFARAGAGKPFGAVVLAGLMLSRLRLGRDGCAHLIGPGDVLDAGAVGDPHAITLARHSLTVTSPVTLALLDDHFLAACVRWPRLSVAIQRRLHTQGRDMFMYQAIAQLPTIEARLIAFFLSLAERFGDAGPNGTSIDVPLTHDVLGELIGARRPTVSLGLTELAHDGRVTRVAGSTWLLAPGLTIPHASVGTGALSSP